ncbi:CDP-alcohol phosphatidyltransferase [Wohlfahrtiimonas chitiniclastica]|uniref:CDP-alcohol phosphatidyltransferase family protein n=1 Tax=Wohlfahrtiimonas chitiniclastica TaxID=400946 RepID=UPI000B97D788|nr:CDP-alcohol phosphatidyltransferase family protein [Wohlfahrtiimonas chitiniclastica]OYQ71114.1 CDP-alcohol phosphatidyltransferase [Wohlfahrtiimonas chitiniclastica]OYQ83037.1 CDP-alcohol phosphatidyltransferase [Wohlfahrtiimonas chitiniclastica]OYQ84930.1 CDP-alcohol phosphatidyltransferase [Wohlfahrtiimonas chitiniclastica]OYQ86836.1 CDP-alcohol phosphatidyltransferase [Wohlfahrtiimonas chitiniclastica]
MITIYQLKPKFQNLLRPLVHTLYQRGITANQVTLLACLGSILTAGIIAVSLPNFMILWLMPIWLFVRMALNAIDGMLAREHQQASKLGAYLNELCDVISDTALMLVLLPIAGINSIAVFSVIFLALLSEYAGVMAPLIGEKRRYDGPMGKSDRAFVLGALCVALALNIMSMTFLNGILWAMVTLLMFTIYQRIKRVL